MPSTIGRKRLLTVVAAVAVSACDGFISSDLERAWQTKHRTALVSGYSDFRGLDISVDVGVDIFTYRFPETQMSTEILSTLEKQIRTAEPCYSVFLRAADEIRLRCATETLGYHGFDEYAVHANQTAHRVTVMWGNFDSEVEVNQQYGYFDSSFRLHVKEEH
jgi:hypothetical protein